MPTFRPVAPEERVRHETVIQHAFDADAGPPDYDGPDDLDDRIAERWGLYDDGELLSACVLYDLDVTLAGGTAPVGGLGAFATPPEHRSSEHGTELQREALATFRERNYPYAVLWAASIPYYRRHGWELVHNRTKYGFAPAAIEDVGDGVPEGRYDRVEPDDHERLVPVHDESRRQFALAIDRTSEWWEKRVLADAWTYCWTPADADEPAGYVVFTLPEEGENSVLEVDELVYGSEAARRALLSLVERHSPQIDWIRWRCPEETRLLAEAHDPGEVSVWIEPGAMGRIVDVREAIARLPEGCNPDDSLTIAVEDSLVADDDVFEIRPGADGPICEPATGTPTPDVVLSIGQLSKLYVGGVDVETAARRDEITADERIRERLATLFPAGSVYLTDFF